MKKLTVASMMKLAANDNQPHYAHPAFWAPFVVVGEGEGELAGEGVARLTEIDDPLDADRMVVTVDGAEVVRLPAGVALSAAEILLADESSLPLLS